MDWPKLKRDYLRWRSELYRLTEEFLTRSSRVELSEYNEVGYFHHVQKRHFDQMREHWEKEKKVSEAWIAKGRFPGIWMAMFSPHNTYSIDSLPVCVIRFYFKDGFYLYDQKNPAHQNLWSRWKRGKKNPWRFLKNDFGESLEKKLKLHGYP